MARSHHNISGIYVIRCIPNDKSYVGSAISIARRWYLHRKALNQGKHHSILLQRAWNKYGEDAFTWEVVEIVPKQDLIAREQFHIDRLCSADPQRGFNICPKAGSSLGLAVTEEAKRKISASLMGKRPSEETRAKLRQRRHSEEWKALAAERMKGNSCTKGNKLTPEHKAKISAWGKNMPQSCRKKLSASTQRMWNNPEIRKRIQAACMSFRRRPSKNQMFFSFDDDSDSS